MSHSIAVRPATPADLPALQGFHGALCAAERASGYDDNADPTFAESPSGQSYLLARINGDGLALIAHDGSVPVGYLVAGVRSTPRGSVSGLESMFVIPACRRRSIGTALLEQFLVWHRASGLRSASLAVAPGNRAAIAFYERAGFRGTTLVMELASPARAHNSEA
jgi:ribosomal protein S18 acetylase RimI-like enzyme